MAEAKTLFGISFMQQQVLNMVMGAANAMRYGELGFAISSSLGFKISDKYFRPVFLSCCEKGLVTFPSWEALKSDLRIRHVVLKPRGAAVISDIGIARGGDSRWYKGFDPFEDYAKHPERLAKLAKGYATMAPRGPKVGNQQIFKDAAEQVRRKTGKMPAWAYG